MTIPLCKNCVHYLPSGKFNDSFSAKCKKIGTLDVVNGVTEYSSAQSVRYDACGEQGALYKPEQRVYLKKIAHHVRRKQFLGYIPMMLITFFVFRKI
jgi:hypothetical protein